MRAGFESVEAQTRVLGYVRVRGQRLDAQDEHRRQEERFVSCRLH